MSDAAIDIRDLSVRYNGFAALNDVTIQVPEGAFLAIIGPNGAGKTTLLHVLLGFESPTVGTVSVMGSAPGAVPRDTVGFIPQLKTLDRSFPARTIELVVTGLRGRWPWRITDTERERAMEVMEQLDIAGLADRSLPTLSGGELQRAYMARCLVRRPKLLLMDEPAAGMDVKGEAEFYHLLDTYQEENAATILMVTHDWEGARFHASHVLLLNRRVLGFGAPDVAGSEERLLAAFGYTGHIGATHHDHA